MKIEKTFCSLSLMVNHVTIWTKVMSVMSLMISTTNSITFSFVLLVKKWETSITQRFKERFKHDQSIWMTTKHFQENSSNILKEQAEPMIHTLEELRDHWWGEFLNTLFLLLESGQRIKTYFQQKINTGTRSFSQEKNEASL